MSLRHRAQEATQFCLWQKLSGSAAPHPPPGAATRPNPQLLPPRPSLGCATGMQPALKTNTSVISPLVHPSIHACVHLWVCLSINPITHPFIHSSNHTCIYSHSHLCIHLNISSIHASLNTATDASIHLSIFPFVWSTHVEP